MGHYQPANWQGGMGEFPGKGPGPGRDVAIKTARGVAKMLTAYRVSADNHWADNQEHFLVPELVVRPLEDKDHSSIPSRNPLLPDSRCSQAALREYQLLGIGLGKYQVTSDGSKGAILDWRRHMLIEQEQVNLSNSLRERAAQRGVMWALTYPRNRLGGEIVDKRPTSGPCL
jgi:hypothetical protein